MPDTLTTITKLINSPPGQLAAGAVLAGIVWKFFERVEVVLNENAKFEIALWLVGAKFTPSTDAGAVLMKLFWAVFGTTVSTRRYITIAVLSTFTAVIDASRFAVSPSHSTQPSDYLLYLPPAIFIIACWLDVAEHTIMQDVGSKQRLTLVSLIAIPVVFRVVVAGNLDNLSVLQALMCGHAWVSACQACLIPVVVVGASIWLPFVSALLLKAARRFDIGFDWFNRKFDIEKKPLQSIGLVAGALVAVVYWAVAIVSRMVG